MLGTTRTRAITAALGLALLAMPATVQAAPALDTGLSAANAAEVTRVQYYRSYGGPRYGESGQHYEYRRAHSAYRRAHRAYRAERAYRYGY